MVIQMPMADKMPVSVDMRNPMYMSKPMKELMVISIVQTPWLYDGDQWCPPARMLFRGSRKKGAVLAIA